MRNLDITDTRSKLFTYVDSGLLTSSGASIPQIASNAPKSK